MDNNGGTNSQATNNSLLLQIILSKSQQEEEDGEQELNIGMNMNSTPISPNTTRKNLRHLSLTTAIQSLSTHQVLNELQILDDFRRSCTNLYQRVRALFFLYAVHRFHLPERRLVETKNSKSREARRSNNGETNGEQTTVVCPKGYAALLDRRFDEAIDYFLDSIKLSSSTISISPDESESTNNGDKDGNLEGGHPIPKRTPLISKLSFSRMDSCATEISEANSSTYQCSTMSSFQTNERLGGEHLLSSGTTNGSNGTTTDDDSLLLLLPSDATSSALAKAYRSLAFQTLADQVKSSVRSHPGNEWMFQLESVADQPLRWSKELFEVEGPVALLERTPVRMDLSHSCWSDIFFLGMDYPEAARVVNCSVDLAVMQQQQHDGGSSQEHNEVKPAPPIECKLQLTNSNPGTIRLTSVDLKSSVLLTHVSQVFNFGADYLGLLKAGLVASGIIPPGWEKFCEEKDMPLKDLLSVMMPDSTNGECLYGLELTTNVHNIPKGSRLAVSTNLLGSIIAVSMRATSQTKSITGSLLEPERRLVAARAILGEWLGGSGGGWQDSGGVWPGLKLIHGVKSVEGDPEYGVSRGRLLPQHKLLSGNDAPPELLGALEKSLVLVHGGMAQNVGPILEMVTEKYLLREEEEWHARHRSMMILDDLLKAFRKCDVKTIAQLVTEK